MTNENDGIELLQRSIAELAATVPKRELPAEVRWSGGGTDRRPSPLHWALATAAAMVVLLAYPVYLGLVELPAARAQLEQVHGAWHSVSAGALDLTVVSLPRQPGSTRSGIGVPETVRLQLAAEETRILLVELVPEWLQPPAPGVATLRLGIDPLGGGGPAVEWRVEVARARQLLEQHEGLPVVVRGGDLAPGDYRLSLSGVSATGSRPLSHLDLVISRPRPAAGEMPSPES